MRKALKQWCAASVAEAVAVGVWGCTQPLSMSPSKRTALGAEAHAEQQAFGGGITSVVPCMPPEVIYILLTDVCVCVCLCVCAVCEMRSD